jgi:hypothetical protein
MTGRDSAGHDEGADVGSVDGLVLDLARAVLTLVAPEELPVFSIMARDWQRDPTIARRRPSDDETLGFGLDLSMWTPVVLTVAGAVAQYLASALADAVVAESRNRLVAVIRRRLRDRATDAADTPPEVAPASAPGNDPGGELTREQITALRDTALQRALAIGVEPATARLLADAFVTSVVEQR